MRFVRTRQSLIFQNGAFLGLLDHYPKDHTDFEDCLAARDRLGETLLEGLTIINQAVRKLLLCCILMFDTRI